ncbi:MAG: hypothetical protein M1815_000295 [Lichina confinis]|nr:MAG: hypothetical protein M1815_000295 [Lichina confinis]
MASRLLIFLGSALLTLGHMEMNKPFPLRSKFDPLNTDGSIDYDLVAPLRDDGADYPCKNYNAQDPWRPVETYVAGSSYRMSIVGGAPHHGGSCQLSMSYDSASTFQVIKSMIGGCPSPTTDYEFMIPSFAPSGRALFAWTWFNLVGNREMYMNCAQVEIKGADSTSADFTNWSTALPEIFRANIGFQGQCTTEEGRALVFPNPGMDVVYGGGVTKDTPPYPGPCADGAISPVQEFVPAPPVEEEEEEEETAEEPLPMTFEPVLRVAATVDVSSEELPAPETTPIPTETIGSLFSEESSTSEALSESTESPLDGANGSDESPILTKTVGSLFSEESSTSEALPESTESPFDEADESDESTVVVSTILTTLTVTASGFSSVFYSDTSANAFGSSDNSTTTTPSPSFESLIPMPTVSPSSTASDLANSAAPASLCDKGQVSCLSRTTWALCNDLGTDYTPMGPVAPGTICIDGRVTWEPSTRGGGDGSCTGEALLRCVDYVQGTAGDEGRDGLGFEVCDQGVWVYMGALAPGTVCRDGEIVAAAQVAGSPSLLLGY